MVTALYLVPVISLTLSMANYLDIYHNGASQRIKYYPGTPTGDILELILKTFHKYPDSKASLEEMKAQCVFYDGDGDPVTFSPSVIPSGTKLHMRIQPVSPNQALVPLSTSEWHFDPVTNQFPQIEFRLSDENKCATMDSIWNNYSKNHGMPVLCGNRSYTTGQHKWRLTWSGEESPYRCFGLISQEEKDKLNREDFGEDFTKYPLLHKFFSHTNGANEYVFKLNMDARVCTIEWRATSPGKQQVRDLPSEVWPAISIKRGHNCTGRISFDF